MQNFTDKEILTDGLSTQKATTDKFNTAANECGSTDYFDHQDPIDVGPYHEKMVVYESQAEAGGLFGPVMLEKVI